MSILDPLTLAYIGFYTKISNQSLYIKEPLPIKSIKFDPYAHINIDVDIVVLKDNEVFVMVTSHLAGVLLPSLGGS